VAGGTRTRRITGPNWIWALDIALIAGGVRLWLGPVRALAPAVTPVVVPWSIVAAALVLAEILVVHIPFRRNAYSFTFSELPLVVGLFFVAPGQLVLAQVVGALVGLVIWRHQSPMKAAFNVGMCVVQSSAAILVFRAIVGSNVQPSPLAAVAALGGTLLGALVTDLMIGLAISLTEGRPQFRTALEMLGVSVFGVAANTALGATVVVVLWQAPWAAVLLLVPGGALFAAYRAYTSQRQRREGVEFLYSAMRMLDRADLEDAIVDLLDRVRDMFRAELAELLVFTGVDGGAPLRATVGPDDRVETIHTVEAPNALEPFVSLLSKSKASLIPRAGPGAHPGGIRDGMFIPLEGEARFLGYLLVANRLGEVSSFDDQDLTLFATFASHLAVSLENGRLARSLEEITALERERAHLLERVVRVAEDERTRLSAELHDGPVQRLSAVLVGLDRVRLRLVRGDVQDAIVLLAQGQQRVSDEVRDLRQLMAELRPPILDERGLEAALTGYVREFEGQTGITAEAEVHVGRRLSASHETVLYRVLQEALTNVRKHSHAGEVAVELRDVGHGVELEVRDDGVGFDPGASGVRIDSMNHFGLSVMRERLEMAGGRFELQSEPGEGTIIVAAFPWERAARTNDEEATHVAV
jgi:signal transduction histidine kinase